ncbi:MAG: FAD-dependent oxidoreductase [Halobacteriales archaeon]|nr:FAD-dependent oxidoreductase [Halobacteriales archaeon]
MSRRVVVLGAGYAGAAAVTALQSIADELDVRWISEHPYHLVLHESHRVISTPAAAEAITIPIEAITTPATDFTEATVTGLDTEARTVELTCGDSIGYEYLLVALGSRTAFYGIPGLEEHALTLKSLDDAQAIHQAVRAASTEATTAEPTRVVVGGAGLSGIQVAGEIAELRDEENAPIEIHLVEALDEVFPGQDPALQRRLRQGLRQAGVKLHLDKPIVEASADVIHFEDRDPLEHDVLIWTGGITGRDVLANAGVAADHNRLHAGSDFRTSDDRVFAIGDTALIEQGEGTVAPPTAQAAWGAAEVAAENIVRASNDQPLQSWTHQDKGTLVSIGERAFAHDVVGMPVTTFGGKPAQFLKKFVAARWIADITTWRRAARAWPYL